MIIFQLIQKPQLRGAEIFACQLSNHLKKSGNDVILISLFEGDAVLPYVGKQIKLNRPLNKRFIDLKGWRQLNELIKQYQPDIIQANAADTLKFAVFSKLRYRWETPIIYRNANKMGDFIKSKFQLQFNKFLVNCTSHVISVSHECESDFKHTFNFPVAKIDTVQIGVEQQVIGNVANDLLTIFTSQPVLVNVAGFVPEKNHKGLIRIFTALVKHYPNAQLLLVGVGKLEVEIKNTIAELGLTTQVHFLGRRNDVLSIIKACDIFVMPSLIEGLPAVILEAMYCKTPVVAYNVGGIGEVVKTGETGWLIQKNEESAFVKAIDNVLTNKELNVQIINNANQEVNEKFMNDDIAVRFEKIYRQVAKWEK